MLELYLFKYYGVRMRKTFILGVGGQKCGTTWLHNYLSNHSETDMGPIKEYHVFDRLFVEEHQHNNMSAMTTISNKMNFYIKNDLNTIESLKVDLTNNLDDYFDFFNFLYNRNKNVALVGDITPAYSALKSSDFLLIKNGLESRGFDVKVVFVMRDPVERIWSLVRMARLKSEVKKVKFFDMSQSEEQQVLDWYQNSRCVKRTQYEKTILALESVFERDKIFLGIYEDFFSEANISALNKFLCLSSGTPDFKFRVNSSPKVNLLSINTKRIITNYYSTTYLSIAERFGCDYIDRFWPSFKLLDD